MNLQEVVCNAVDSARKELNEVALILWNNPELGLNEHLAHKTLTDFLEKHGFAVERSYILRTAFRATFCSGKKTGPNVAVLCEYDALPGLGHGCGHNLIAEVGLAAALGIKAALSEGSLEGKLTVMGTPAEENKSGKIQLIKGGAFDGVDIAMMSHPSNANVSTPKLPSFNGLIVQYRGVASHTCTAPWEGVNALDAAVMAYQSLSVLRQQIQPDWRISAIITDGGVETSIIPDYAEMKISYRTMTVAETQKFGKKIEDCLNSAAVATRCQVTIKVDYEDTMLAMRHNHCLAEIYETHSKSLGISLNRDDKITNGLFFSTDMGDVSETVPCIHPVYEIGTTSPNHTTEFTKASGDSLAQEPTLQQGKALALCGISVLQDAKVLQKIQREFAQQP